MNHYLVYHSAEKMGRSFREDDAPGTGTGVAGPGEFSIVTSKKAAGLPGSVVWVISGEGRPRQYRLEYWFRVVRVDARRDQGFSNTASGSWGASFHGGVRLDELEWFAGFRERFSNFSLGLMPIPEEFVRHLYAAARSAGEAPTDEYRTAPTVPPAQAVTVGADSTEAGPAPRRAALVDRVVRDTAITLAVKALHGHRCQACGLRLETPAGLYAEGAHVRPLGTPHDGPDVPENVVCLCPNCHVLFDWGAFTVADDLALVGREGRFAEVPGHRPSVEFLRYHREHVYVGAASRS